MTTGRGILSLFLNDVPELFKSVGVSKFEDVDSSTELAKPLILKLQMLMVGTTNPVDADEVIDSLKHLNAPSSTCGRIFRNGDPTFACRDCANDPTCVLCQNCFQESTHRTHNYVMYTSNGGGCCDCGDQEAWVDGTAHCSKHRTHTELNDDVSCVNPVDLLPKGLALMAGPLLQTTILYITWVLAGGLEWGSIEAHNDIDSHEDQIKRSECVWVEQKDYGPKWHAVLVNDETHSFNSVITQVQKAINVSKERREEIAKIVDSHGWASVLVGSRSRCEAACATLNEIHLKTRIVNSKVMAHIHCAMAMTKWLRSLCSASDGLRSLVCEALIAPIDDIYRKAMIWCLVREKGRMRNERVSVRVTTRLFGAEAHEWVRRSGVDFSDTTDEDVSEWDDAGDMDVEDVSDLYDYADIKSSARPQSESDDSEDITMPDLISANGSGDEEPPNNTLHHQQIQHQHSRHMKSRVRKRKDVIFGWGMEGVRKVGVGKGLVITYLDMMLLCDNYCWKAHRHQLQRLYIDSLLHDVKYKQMFAFAYICNYKAIQSNFTKGDNLARDSITNISVQLFTVPSVVAYLNTRLDVLGVLVDTLEHVLEPVLKHEAVRKKQKRATKRARMSRMNTDIPKISENVREMEASFRNSDEDALVDVKNVNTLHVWCGSQGFHYSRRYHVLVDLKYCLRHTEILLSTTANGASMKIEKQCANNMHSDVEENYYVQQSQMQTYSHLRTQIRSPYHHRHREECWVKHMAKLCGMFNGMNAVKRKMGTHVEYEDQSWLHAINLYAHAAPCFSLFAKLLCLIDVGEDIGGSAIPESKNMDTMNVNSDEDGIVKINVSGARITTADTLKHISGSVNDKGKRKLAEVAPLSLAPPRSSRVAQHATVIERTISKLSVQILNKFKAPYRMSKSFDYIYNNSEYDQSQRAVSMHQPLHRVLAEFYMILGQKRQALPNPLPHNHPVWKQEQPAKYCLQIMKDDVVAIQAFVAQVNAGMWARNGASIKSQVYHYLTGQLRDHSYDLDIVYLQGFSTLVPADEMISSILEKFQLKQILAHGTNSKLPDNPSEHYSSLKRKSGGRKYSNVSSSSNDGERDGSASGSTRTRTRTQSDSRNVHTRTHQPTPRVRVIPGQTLEATATVIDNATGETTTRVLLNTRNGRAPGTLDTTTATGTETGAGAGGDEGGGTGEGAGVRVEEIRRVLGALGGGGLADAFENAELFIRGGPDATQAHVHGHPGTRRRRRHQSGSSETDASGSETRTSESSSNETSHVESQRHIINMNEIENEEFHEIFERIGRDVAERMNGRNARNVGAPGAGVGTGTAGDTDAGGGTNAAIGTGAGAGAGMLQPGLVRTNSDLSEDEHEENYEDVIPHGWGDVPIGLGGGDMAMNFGFEFPQAMDMPGGGPGDNHGEAETKGSILEHFLLLVIALVAERYQEGVGMITRRDIIRRELIHQLCIGPTQHSKLAQTIKTDLVEDKAFDEELKALATYTAPQSTKGSGRYDIDGNAWQEYTPFFYHYDTKDRQSAEKARLQRVKLLASRGMTSTSYKPTKAPPPFTLAFEPVLRVLDSHVLHTVLLDVCVRVIHQHQRNVHEEKAKMSSSPSSGQSSVSSFAKTNLDARTAADDDSDDDGEVANEDEEPPLIHAPSELEYTVSHTLLHTVLHIIEIGLVTDVSDKDVRARIRARTETRPHTNPNVENHGDTHTCFATAFGAYKDVDAWLSISLETNAQFIERREVLAKHDNVVDHVNTCEVASMSTSTHTHTDINTNGHTSAREYPHLIACVLICLSQSNLVINDNDLKNLLQWIMYRLEHTSTQPVRDALRAHREGRVLNQCVSVNMNMDGSHIPTTTNRNVSVNASVSDDVSEDTEIEDAEESAETERKAKMLASKARQKAILEKFKAQQSKFMAHNKDLLEPTKAEESLILSGVSRPATPSTMAMLMPPVTCILCQETSSAIRVEGVPGDDKKYKSVMGLCSNVQLSGFIHHAQTADDCEDDNTSKKYILRQKHKNDPRLTQWRRTIRAQDVRANQTNSETENNTKASTTPPTVDRNVNSPSIQPTNTLPRSVLSVLRGTEFNFSSGSADTIVGGGVITSCGHAMHQDCHSRYMTSLLAPRSLYDMRMFPKLADPRKGEFLCPLCKKLNNTLLPYVWQPYIEDNEFIEAENEFGHPDMNDKADELFATWLKSLESPRLQTFNQKDILGGRNTSSTPNTSSSVSVRNEEMNNINNTDIASSMGTNVGLGWGTNATVGDNRFVVRREDLNLTPTLYSGLLSRDIAHPSTLFNHVNTESMGDTVATSWRSFVSSTLPKIFQEFGSTCDTISKTLSREKTQRSDSRVIRTIDSIIDVCAYTIRTIVASADALNTVEGKESVDFVSATLTSRQENCLRGLCHVLNSLKCKLPDRISQDMKVHKMGSMLRNGVEMCNGGDSNERVHLALDPFTVLVEAVFTMPPSQQGAQQDARNLITTLYLTRVSQTCLAIHQILARGGSAANAFESEMRDIYVQSREDWSGPAHLPDFNDLFNDASNVLCACCGTHPQNPALCLVCGVYVCAQSACCKIGNIGECTRHARSCGAGVALFMLVKRCMVLLLCDGRGSLYPSVYLDSHGERDDGLRRGHPLHLNRFLYAELERLWLGLGVADEIVRNNDLQVQLRDWHDF
eukprot:CFRG5787T1